MGTVIIGISYFIQTDTITIDVILISIPIAIFIGAIMLSNNIRDRVGDEESGRKTIAILLGHDRAVNFLASMFIVAYVLTRSEERRVGKEGCTIRWTQNATKIGDS